MPCPAQAPKAQDAVMLHSLIHHGTYFDLVVSSGIAF